MESVFVCASGYVVRGVDLRDREYEVESMLRCCAEGCPTCDERVEHKVNRRGQVILDEVVAFIRETGDGRFAFALSNALQLLPEVEAHVQHVIDQEQLASRPVVRGLPTRDVVSELFANLFNG